MILDLAYYIYNYLKKYRPFGFLIAIFRKFYRLAWPIELQNGFYNADFSNEDIERNREILNRWREEKNKSIKSMTWFMPPLDFATAGPKNILDFIRLFLDRGVEINIVLLGDPIAVQRCWRFLRNSQNYSFLKGSRIFRNPRIDKLPYTDAGIATKCDTAHSLVKFNNTKGKFYFIQDDERLLYTDRIQIGLAEQTYRFGFIGMTNAEALKEMYIKEFGGRAESYFPTPAHIKPAEIRLNRRIKRLFFYARPEWPRNGFVLGMNGLREVKRRHPEVEIVLAGSDTKFKDYGFEVSNLGKLPYNQVPELYARCDVGIYIILSRHTGVIPFELMACGCAVLKNRSEYNQSPLRHMENCVMFDLTPSSIADAFDVLYCDEKLYQKIVAGGLQFIREMPTLEEELSRIYAFMLS